MNAATHKFNRIIYESGNRIKQNKNSIYKGTPEDKEKILKILDEKYQTAISKPNNIIGEKNLIYFSVFGNGYTMLFELLLKSIEKYNDIEQFDLLIITDTITKKFITSIKVLEKFRYDFHIIDTPSDEIEASISKCYIFDYKKINDYKNILYLDSDILCVGNITPLFLKTYDNIEVVDNGYEKYNIDPEIISAATITHSLCYFLSNESDYINKKKPMVFNAGQYLFSNTDRMKSHFENIRWLISVWPSVYFYEQSFMNQYFVLRKLCNYDYLNPRTKLMLNISPFFLDKNGLESGNENLPYQLIHFAANLTSLEKYTIVKKYIEYNNICL
jgi:hypothetical protein